jgi:hypothetical protein
MARQVWQQLMKYTGGEGVGTNGKAVVFPNDWDETEDLFYVDGIWIDGLPVADFPIEVVFSTDSNNDVSSGTVGYSFIYSGGFQDLPNPIVLAKGYAFIILIGSTADLRVSFYGDLKKSKANPDLALVTFGSPVYGTAPVV